MEQTKQCGVNDVYDLMSEHFPIHTSNWSNIGNVINSNKPNPDKWSLDEDPNNPVVSTLSDVEVNNAN